MEQNPVSLPVWEFKYNRNSKIYITFKKWDFSLQEYKYQTKMVGCSVAIPELPGFLFEFVLRATEIKMDASPFRFLVVASLVEKLWHLCRLPAAGFTA